MVHATEIQHSFKQYFIHINNHLAFRNKALDTQVSLCKMFLKKDMNNYLHSTLQAKVNFNQAVRVQPCRTTVTLEQD